MSRSTLAHLCTEPRIEADVVRAQLGVVREPPRPHVLALVRSAPGPRS